MNIEFSSAICYDVLAIPVSDDLTDISFCVDFDKVREQLLNYGIVKAYDLHEKIDFLVQIDSADTFDTVNLRQYYFSQGKEINRGNIVFDGKFFVSKPQFYNTVFYIRVKPVLTEINVTVKTNTVEIRPFKFICDWSDIHTFNQEVLLTQSIITAMYNMIPDINVYSKEANSANFIYILQAFATVLNSQYQRLNKTKNNYFLFKCHPSNLMSSFGSICNFNLPLNTTLEEYRRILKYMLLAYQNGGSSESIRNILMFFSGYKPVIDTFQNIYGWVIRKANLGHPYCTIENSILPIENEDGTITNITYKKYKCAYRPQNYTDITNNYFVYNKNFVMSKNNNIASLTKNSLKTFTFYVYNDNYYNRDLKTDSVKDILNKFKSVYEMYLLKETDKEAVIL